MNRRVYRRDAVERDLVEHFVFLAENSSLETADRFLTNAEASFNDLAEHPMMGASLTSQHPDLAGMRQSPHLLHAASRRRARRTRVAQGTQLGGCSGWQTDVQPARNLHRA